MANWIETYKPAASRRTHLLLAAAMWTVVGSLLFYFGAHWVVRSGARHAELQIAAAVAVGVVKAFLALDRAAGRIVTRILARGDHRCIGGFLSLKTWLIVAVMATVGRLLRAGLLPMHVVGLLYAAIGTALLVGARNFWRAWYVQLMAKEP